MLNHVITTKAAYIMSSEEFVPRLQHMRSWARAAISCRRLAQMIMEQKSVKRVDGDDAGNEVVLRPRSLALGALTSLHEDLQQSLAQERLDYTEIQNDSDGNLYSPGNMEHEFDSDVNLPSPLSEFGSIGED